MKNKFKIAAVVVTYNRLKLLKQCIDSLRTQTRKLDEIIVVNNLSNDGTLEWLKEQTDLTVITQENSGSAGGQFTGIKTAYEKGYDWIWCLDTDVILEKNSLQNLIDSDCFNRTDTGFLSSTIYFTDGKLAYPNIPELNGSYNLADMVAFGNPAPILSASFGSLLINRKIIKQVGYPCKDFFIWGDDAEFTLRIIKNGFKGYMVTKSNALHECGVNNPKPYLHLKMNDTKFIYGMRNMVYVAIQRNQITHNSTVRGYLSGLFFVIRLYKDHIALVNSIAPGYLMSCLRLYFKGIFFRPEITKPES